MMTLMKRAVCLELFMRYAEHFFAMLSVYM